MWLNIVEENSWTSIDFKMSVILLKSFPQLYRWILFFDLFFLQMVSIHVKYCKEPVVPLKISPLFVGEVKKIK